MEYESLKLLTKTFRERIISHDRRYEHDQEIKKIKSKTAISKLKRSQSILQELKEKMNSKQNCLMKSV